MYRKRKTKILLVCYDYFPPFRVDVSVLFGKKLAGRGHAVDFLMQSDGPCDKAYETMWSGCHAFVGRTDVGASMVRRARKNLFRILHELRMLRRLKTNRYDVLITKDVFLSAFLGLFASRASGTRFIYWLSYPFPEAWLYEAAQGTARYRAIYRMGGHLMGLLLYRLILPFADHVFVQSEQMRRDISTKGVPLSKMTAVLMGVEANKIPFFGYEPNSHVGSEERVVVYLGTLVKVRRLDFLIRAFFKVWEKDKMARLCLVGGGEDPSDEQLLRDEVNRLGLQDAVTMTGFIPRVEAWEWVRRADVCVSPFYPTLILNSTSPTKLIEYMAMGKAVVANDHPEQKAVLAESGAGLCVAYEENAFAEAIRYLLDHPVEAAEMGRRGRAYVENHRDYEIIANLVEARTLQVLET